MRSLVILCFAATMVGCSGMMMSGGSGSAGASAGGVSASTSSGSRAGGGATASQPSDVEITSMVREALMRDSRIGRASISVHTRSGMVELGGVAPDYQAREAAERLAMSVDGVRGVDNRITVQN